MAEGRRSCKRVRRGLPSGCPGQEENPERWNGSYMLKCLLKKTAVSLPCEVQELNWSNLPQGAVEGSG